MVTSKTNSAQPQATASTRSPSPKPDTSRDSSRLSDSEIESLKKDDAQASEQIKAILAKAMQATN